MCNKFKSSFFSFRTGFRPINGERLIRLVRRDMRIDQALFFLEVEHGIPGMSLEEIPCRWSPNNLVEKESSRTLLRTLNTLKIKIVHYYKTAFCFGCFSPLKLVNISLPLKLKP